MKIAMARRKRPCPICRRWSRPDHRLKERQKTCGKEPCKREWHRRKCAEWNRENSPQIRRERLVHNLKAIAAQGRQPKVTGEAHPGTSPVQNGSRTEQLPPLVQEVMAIQLAVIIEYLAQHLLKLVQEVIRR